MTLAPRHQRFEFAFREWVASNGYGLQDVAYERSTGGRAEAMLLGAKRNVSAVAVVAHATGNDKYFPLLDVYRRLLGLGFAVFAFDLDGHGRGSTHRLNVETATSMLPEAMAEARRLVPGRPLHLVGQSFGALLVMHQLAMTAKDAGVRSCILLSPPVSGQIVGRPLWLEGRSVLTRTWLHARRTYGFFGRVPAVGPFKRALYPLRLGGGYQNWNVMSYAGLIDRLVEIWKPDAQFDPNRVPTLLMYGQRDVLTPPDQAELLAQRFKSPSEFHVLKGETHFTTPMSDACLRLIDRWMAK